MKRATASHNANSPFDDASLRFASLSDKLFHFIQDLMNLIPNAFFYPRREFQIKEITQYAANKKFTHLIVLSEKSKVCNGMIVSNIPAGPTAYFKVSNIIPGKVSEP